jgi:hypothetical protein
MMAFVRRAILAAVVGAVAAALSLVAAYTVHPGLTFEMDRPLPSFMTGMHGLERDAFGSFSWSSGRVEARIPGIDRLVEWSCTIRLRGPRPESQPPAVVRIDVDGVPVVGPLATTAEYNDIGVRIPPATTNGMSIVLNVEPTFRPGTADRRDLGVQIDRWLCRPAADFLRPPENALARASLAAAIFAAGLALIGLSLSSTLFAAAFVALGQTVMLAVSSGIYTDLPARLPWIALWTILPAVAIARALERLRRVPLSSSARFVLAASASALMLKLAGLLHPSKPIIDALFNAHRLGRVLDGDLFFTQPMPDGVQFPYAIGLYIFAAPWAWIAANHVALIWTVTAAAEAVAAALLYPVIVRAWGDRRAAAMAVVLLQLTPLSLEVLGNANLPNIFGQALSVVTIGAAVTWRLAPSRLSTLAGLFALTTAAFCTHISTVTMLPVVLGVMVVIYWWRGGAENRATAGAIAMALVAGLVAAWLLYWRHFMDVYRAAASKMFAGTVSTELLTEAGAVKGEMSAGGRIWNLVEQAVSSAGAPLLILAAIGAWALIRRRTRDRLTAALIAWAALWTVFSAATVFAKVDREFIRYAAEYLGRINLATLPLIAILAGKGASLGWDAGTHASSRRALQIAALVLVAWALVLAVNEWTYWFRR